MLAQPLDILIGTPQKLMQHAEKGNLFWGDVQYVVLDEADTMFDKGFGPEVRAVLGPLRSKAHPANAVLVVATLSKVSSQILFCSGTCTRWCSAPVMRSMQLHGTQYLAQTLGDMVAKCCAGWRDSHSLFVHACCITHGRRVHDSMHSVQAIRSLLSTEFPDLKHIETSTLHRGVAGARHSFLPSPPALNKLDVLRQAWHRSPKQDKRRLSHDQGKTLPCLRSSPVSGAPESRSAEWDSQPG